jgi:DNA-binding transcriptional regulator YiaG
MLYEKDLGENILAIRTRFNETRAQFATRLGVSAESIRKWESGKTVPVLDKHPRLKAVLKNPAPKSVNTLPDKWTVGAVSAMQKRSGLSVPAFATVIGVSGRLLNKWYKGRMRPTAHTIEKLNRVYTEMYPDIKEAGVTKQNSSELTGETIRALRERYGETSRQFGRRFNVSGAYISGWETGGQPVPQKHHEKLLRMLRKVDAPEPPVAARPKTVKTETAPLPVGTLLQSVQGFKDMRDQTLVQDALKYVAQDTKLSELKVRQVIAIFLHIVNQEVPLHVILAELTGHST